MNPYKYKKILWLCPPNFSGGLQHLVEKHLENAGLANANIRIRCFSNKCLKKTGKKTYTWDQSKYPHFMAQIKKFDPDFIICNDKAALGLITQDYISLALTRGSVYKLDSIPVLVIDDVKKTKSMPHGSWVFKQDIQKLKRWLTGTQRHQPKFSYTVCENLEQVAEAKRAANNSILIGTDIETSGQGSNVIITCSGYTCWKKDGTIHTYVLPFVDTTQKDGCFWRNKSDEALTLQAMRDIHANPVPKVLQNGSYDSAHIIVYQMPYNNYIVDTLHLFHSMYAESPKKLDFITSLCLDFYRYWKDESKEDAKDDAQKTMVPQTAFGMRNYWRYNALDCYYTTLDTLMLLKLIQMPHMKWALDNYLKEFAHQTGFCLAGSLRGIKWNRKLQSAFNISLIKESDQAEVDLRKMVGDTQFNSNSPKQVAQLVYDVLKSEEIPRKKRTTAEPILKLVQTQHPLTKRIIDQIWKIKKPANNASKYGSLILMNDRFMYKILAAGTETGRQATKQSDFWRGGNVQNVPDPMRVLYEADEGYVLFDFDYSQSDAYFTAFESEDPKFMETMLSPDDTHCIHAEHFFQIPYEKLIKAKKNHEDWCVHKVTGVRSVTKRAVYGANYLMAGYTLFITMGIDAVTSAAKHLGYEDAGSWNYKQLTYLCTKLIESYFDLYSVLPAWLEEEISKAVSNSNLVTCYGGLTRLFFKDLRNDNSGQRELASFFGQGGTAGNINAFLHDFYYNTGDSTEIMFLFQVHDSVVGQVRKDKLHLLRPLKEQMERKCTIHGRKFVVPVEGQVGIGWGKRMIDWSPKTTLKEIENHDKEWWKKWHKKTDH